MSFYTQARSELIKKAQNIYDERMQAEMEREKKRRELEWQTMYQQPASEYARLEEIEAKKALDREMARAAAMLGYSQYGTGAGTSGTWEANKLALQKAAQEQYGNVAQLNQKIMQQLYLDYLNRKDTQKFQLELAKYAHEARMQEMEKMAELNDESWWQSIGSSVGSFFAMMPLIASGLGIPYYGVGSTLKAIPYMLF